jgi:hypothetical protein
MNHRIVLLWFFVSVFSAANAANEVKPPIVLRTREAKLSPGMMTFVSSTLPGPYVGGWTDKSRSIDYELKVEPGRYRLVVSVVPQGGGYLYATVDDGLAIRKQISKLRESMYKPIEIKFGEIDIPKAGSHLRFTGDNITMPGLCLFFQAELTWVAPLTAASKAKSPLQLQAEREKELKDAEVAKRAQALRDNLKGTTWSFCHNHNFEESGSTTLVFSLDGNLSYANSPGRSYKVVDSRTIDILYSSSSGMAFSRLRFADDMGSFKSNLEEGIRQPRSGKLQQVLGSPARKPSESAAGPALRDKLKGTSWSFCINHTFEGSGTLVFGVDGTLSLRNGSSRLSFKVVDSHTIDVSHNSSSGVGSFSRLRFAEDMGSFKSDLTEGIRQPLSGKLLQALGSPARKPGESPTRPASSGI